MRQRACELLGRGKGNAQQHESQRVPRNQRDTIGNPLCPACDHPVTADNGVPTREYLIHPACYPSPSLSTPEDS
jgi:hypothetical protein